MPFAGTAKHVVRTPTLRWSAVYRTTGNALLARRALLANGEANGCQRPADRIVRHNARTVAPASLESTYRRPARRQRTPNAAFAKSA